MTGSRNPTYTNRRFMRIVVYKSFCASVQCDGIITECERQRFLESWITSVDGYYHV